ncbi:hypothetical protein N3K66_002134 [Trichothecium roseum]|uniref:Uncharacterized protein n=1 Tax=Trichothecium roseum TaxID=47278 RepID=A0ACC0VA62_9HYPO|nr:hypothetical protein N3K66_002134 [Trichothecium roseum]
MLNKNQAVASLLLAGGAQASLLYVASYSGYVSTLNLTDDGSGAKTLESVAESDGCSTAPSWLTLDKEKAVLYCLDEGFGTWPNGSFASLQTNDDGSLTLLDKEVTINGPVSAVPFGESGIAVAHYSGSGLTTWNVADPSAVVNLETQVYELDGPGADPERQEAPHPHEAVTDPTGKFVLVPDLGADLVRVFSVSAAGDELAPAEPLAVAAGSGPRHVTFAVHGETTYMYLITELSNQIFGYVVSYDEAGLGFEQIWESGTHGKDVEVPEYAGAAEILVTPDQNFLIASSRNESSFDIPSFHGSNATIPSDALISFSIDAATGALETLQEVPAGGLFPRHFSYNDDASLVAVGLQSDGRVVVISRDVETGELGDFVAWADVEGEVSNVIFA